MRRFILALWRGLIGRCPQCGRGKLFKSFYGIRERCAVCDVQFERTGNQSTGGMAINLVLTLMLGFAGGIWLVLRDPNAIFPQLFILIGGLMVFHVLFYRPAKGLWLGLTSLTGDMEHDG